MKRCSMCKAVKPLSDFYGGSGTSHRCKSCERQYANSRYNKGGRSRRELDSIPEIDPPFLSSMLRNVFNEHGQHGPVRILVKDGKPVGQETML